MEAWQIHNIKEILFGLGLIVLLFLLRMGVRKLFPKWEQLE